MDNHLFIHRGRRGLIELSVEVVVPAGERALVFREHFFTEKFCDVANGGMVFWSASSWKRLVGDIVK